MVDTNSACMLCSRSLALMIPGDLARSLPRPLQAGAPSSGHRHLGRDGRSERIGQLVDLDAGAALGDRDEQAVLVLGEVAPQWVARRDPALGATLEDAVDRRVEPDRELAGDRRL